MLTGAIRPKRYYILFALLCSAFFVFIAVSMFMFFERSRAVMADHVKLELRKLASMQAWELSQNEADAIQRIRNRSDMQDPSFARIVQSLQGVRNTSPYIRFAYVLRRTADPYRLEFVADADSLAGPEELDVNRNGTVDPDEAASYPGDSYDISNMPALQNEAFLRPSTDIDFSVDAWGTWMSGYAPIRDTRGTVIAIVGIDMSADVFNTLTRAQLPIFIIISLACLVFVGAAAVLLYGLYLARKQAIFFMDGLQQRYDDEHKLLASVVANLPVALFCKDAAKGFRFILWNKKSEEIFGLTSAQVIGKDDYDLFPKDQSDFFRTTDENVMRGQVVVDIPEEVIDARGRGRIWLHTRKVPVRDSSSRPRFLLGISMDITETHKMRKALKERADDLENAVNTIVHRENAMIELKKKLKDQGSSSEQGAP